MDNTDTLLGDLAGGDKAPALDAPQPDVAMKRDQDSTDDFEHLERDTRQETVQQLQAAASRSFLDMERGLQEEAPRAPSADNIADKFTDSESDADSAESPRHRPAPEPAPLLDLTPAPAPAPAPVLASDPPLLAQVLEPSLAFVSLDTPLPEKLKPSASSEAQPEYHKPELPKPELTKPELPKPELPKPELPKPEPPKPEPPKPEPARREPSPPRATSPPEPQRPVAHVIEAEVIFCQMGLDAWFDPQRLHPEVEALVYWRSAARSGAALGAGLALLLALASCSVVSVGAYAALLALSAAVAFRVYRNVLQAVQKTNDGHPFRWLLERDVSLSAERAQALAAAATAHLNAALHELRRLFLVEDLVDSLKFGVLLWCLTYVGACFNGITLIILGWIALFTLPKAYELNKAQVDANLELARAKINEISAKVRAAVPLGRKGESDKEK